MAGPNVVTETEWRAALAPIRAQEKRTRERGALAARRRRLPVVEIEQPYEFTGPGRQEDWEDSPAEVAQESPYQWWRRHPEYTRKELNR